MKIKLNTVKSKVLAGVAAVTLVSGAGFAAASLDAGAQLQSWYDKAFGVAKFQVDADAKVYGTAKNLELAAHAGDETADAVKQIKTTKEEEKNAKTESIRAAKQGHIEAVDKKQSEIEGYMASQFGDLYEKNLKTFNFTSDLTYKGAELGMRIVVNPTGDAAFKALQKELNAEKESAKSELALRITSAKDALMLDLETNRDATKDEFRAAVDKKISELKKDITDKKEELVAKHQEKLIAKANEIEAAAKAEMDEIVTAGFNN